METQIKIGYEVLLPKISEQLTQQGFKFSPKKVKEFESYREALQNLHLGNILTETMYKKALKKLDKKVVYHVKIKNITKK